MVFMCLMYPYAQHSMNPHTVEPHCSAVMFRTACGTPAFLVDGAHAPAVPIVTPR